MSDYVNNSVKHYITPDDPEWKQPLTMGDPYEQGLTPHSAREKIIKEAEQRNEPNGYGGSQIAHMPEHWIKHAQATGVNNIMTQPMWFSPLHTPQNWQIASKRREVYQWLVINSCEITTYDYTCRAIADLNFVSSEVIEDTITGGLLYENIESEKVFAGKGAFRRPLRYSIREIKDKRCFSFHAYGYWRSVETSEEHPMIILDGKLYRHKKKVDSNAAYRRKKGIIPNGAQKVDIPETLISRKEAQNVSDQDYLLAPMPQMGDKRIDSDLSWLLGIVISDGTISNSDVRVTLDKRDEHRGSIVEVLNKFPGKTRERPHHSKYGWRICKTTRDCRDFCSKYITGKLTEKRFTAELFSLNKEARLHVLGGYFDGDGSYSKSQGKLIANNYSCDMADQIYWLLLSVGIRASLGRYPLYGDHYETNSKWVYRVFIPQADIPKLQPYMRSDKIPEDFKPRNTRELRFFYEEDGVTYLAQPIESIKQFRYTGPGYDLQIDPERSFVASGFVTSNCRFFYENEPKVAAAIDFYSQFGLNGFKLECKSTKVAKWFEHYVVKRLRLNEFFQQFSQEYYMLGDVFVHTDIECPVCLGSSIDPDSGDPCNHPGGTIGRATILNPDWIEVQRSPHADDPVIVMVPDEEMKRIVHTQKPKAIYDRIPDAMKELIMQGRPIPLSTRTTSHMRHMPAPYGTYGTSIIRRLFTTLAYKTKIMTANWIVAERLILPIRVVKVGSDQRPASPADIADIQQQLAQTANDPNLTIVTHNNFDYDWYGTSGKVLQITQEMEHIDKEILDGVMLNQSLLNGEMSGYSSAQVGVETLIRRIESWRHKLKEWCEDNLFRPIAEMQGFIDEQASSEIGETVYLYPKIKWNKLQLRDEQPRYQILMQLHDKQVISTQTLLEEQDFDYDQEVERLRYEQAVSPMPMGGMGAAGGGGGMGLDGGMGGGGGMPGEGMDPMGGMGGMGDMGAGGAPGGDMGGMGGMPGGAMADGMKVLKKGKSTEQGEENAQPQVTMVKLTSIEQKMAKMLHELASNMNINPNAIRAQFPIQKPEGGKPWMLDFALPNIKLGVECLHPDTLVQTTSGSRKAKDVKETDLLFGRDGSIVSIKRKIKNQHDGELLSLKPFGMLPFEVTPNHPMLVCRSSIVPGEPEFINASDVKIGDFLVIPKKRMDESDHEVDTIDFSVYNGKSYNSHKLDKTKITTDLAWLLGIYVAEGSCDTEKGSDICFSFNATEQKFIERTQFILKHQLGLPSTLHRDKKCSTTRVSTSCKALSCFLVSNFSKLSSNKSLPAWMLKMSNDHKRSFLEGYCDGDGCIRGCDGANGFVSSSKALLMDVQAMAWSMGFWGSLIKSREPDGHDIIGQRCQANELYELVINFMGCSKKQYREDEHYFYSPVKKITSRNYTGDVINYETQGAGEADHTFIVGNVVSHNCDGQVWHSNADQVSGDQKRDHLLAQRGWTILRFNDKTIDDAPQAVNRTISSYIKKIMSATNQKSGNNHLFIIKEGELCNLQNNYAAYNEAGLLNKIYASTSLGG